MSDDELMDALRAATVGGSQIDPLFWDKFAQLCRWDQGKKSEIPSAADIRCFVQLNSVRVPASWKYQLMDVLYKRVQIDPTAEYSAVATQAELQTIECKFSVEDDAAISFIYKDPLQFKRVRRLFAVNSWTFFDTLPEERLNSLRKQCKLGIDLRVYEVKENDEVPNFGIYGRIAVGRMLTNATQTTEDNVNEVSFSKIEVDAARAEFDKYFVVAEPLWDVLQKVRKRRNRGGARSSL
jgi:hypothetical protein